MRAGRIRRKITIKSYTRSQDDYGHETETWNTFATVWAAIEPIQGKEYWEADKQNAEVTTRIRIRYIKNLKPFYMIHYGKKKKFEIISIINDKQANRELILMCQEIVEHAKSRS